MGSIATYPLSQIQKKIWESGFSSRSVSLSAEIHGPLDAARWDAAIQSVVRRHEIPRTNFEIPAGLTVPVQTVCDQSSWRFELSQNQHGPWTFSVSAPTMAADAWTLRELLSEAARNYAGSPDNGDVFQYAQFASWLAGVQGDTDPEAAEYRRKQRVRIQLRQNFSFDSLADESAPALEYYRVVLPPQTKSALLDAARREGVTAADWALAGWALLVGRHCETSDVTMAYVADGRIYDEFHHILGAFASPLPLNLVLPASAGLREVSKNAAEAVDALATYQFHFDNAAGESAPIAFERRNALPISANGLAISLRQLRADNYPCRIKLVFEDKGTDFEMFFACRGNAYSDAAVAELARQLTRLLDEAVSAPQKPYRELNLMDGDSAQRLISYATGAAVEIGHDSIQSVIDRKAFECPAAKALVFREKATSYRELLERTNQLAWLLHDRGVGAGDLVAILMDRSDSLILLLLASLKAGAAYLPLDPQFPPARIRGILEDSNCRLLVTDRTAAFDIPPGLEVCDAEMLIAASRERPAFPLALAELPDPTAYVLYTSGSTGRPKGCAIGMRSLCNYVLWANDYYGRYGVFGGFGLYTSISFDLTVTSIFCALTQGNPLHIYEESQSVDRILAHSFSRDSGIDSVKLTPSHLRLLKELGIRPEGVSTVIIGGEALERDLAAYLFSVDPNIAVFNEYGPTEATVGCVVKKVEVNDRRILIGRPIWNSRMAIVDEAGSPVPPGVPGELHIAGIPLAKGYWNNEPMTANSFRVDAQGVRFYSTGDFARWNENGEIDYLGRRDEQIKIRGNRIELGEIRHTLLQLPGVKDALVVVHNRDAEHGEPSIIAYLLTDSGEEISGATAYLRQFLTDAMMPQLLIPVPQFPVTPNGKVDLRALPQPEEYAKRGAAGYIAPRSDIGREIAEVWRSVLAVERIGIHDSFFRLGGDSIRAIQSAARLGSRGLKLEIRDILDHPTIAELELLAKPKTARSDDGPVSGRVYPVPIQIKLFEEHPDHAHHYNQSVELLVLRDLDPSVLEAALTELVRYHDALRTVVRRNNNEITLEVSDNIHGPLLCEYDWRGRPGSHDFAAAWAATHLSISPESGALLRAALLRTDTETRLYLVVHHMVVDGLSWRILLEDLNAACRQPKSALPVLPPKTDSVQQWSSALHLRRNDPFFMEELPYWVETLRGQFAKLPVDFPQGDNRFRSIQTLNEVLPADVTAALLTDAHQPYRTEIGDLLLTALANLLAGRSNTRRILVYVEGHGRDLLPDGPDVSRTVGWFTAKYPLVLELVGDNAGTQIKHIKEQIRAVPHRGNGYGVLRYLSDSEKTLALDRTIEPQVSFNYLGQVTVDGSALFQAVPEGLDNDSIHPDLDMRQDLSFTGIVQHGRLNIAISYSRERFRRLTVEALLREYVDALTLLIRHCMERTTVELTPSDVDYGGFATISEMDEFLDKLESS